MKQPDLHTFAFMQDCLKRLANLVHAESKELASNPALPPEFMALALLRRQLNHVHSILQLGINADVELIVRSMLEGMVNAVWASHDLPSRSVLWQAFALVSAWRDATFNPYKKDAHEAETITAQIQDHPSYHQLLTKAALAALKQGKPLPSDPYIKNWRGKNLQDTIKEIAKVNPSNQEGQQPIEEGLHQFVYGPMSAWHHWDFTGFLRVSASQSVVLGALASAFQSLHLICEFANKVLSLGIEVQLRDERERYIKTLRGQDNI